MNGPVWRKSTHSGTEEVTCVEVADLAPSSEWRKSTHSATEAETCVEVANFAPAIGVRDSTDPDGPKLLLSAASWRTLTRQIKASEHDLA
ncbi:DUF397 domain-containing protein [Actinomadura terrae]|uniref:DUF397 domain-containing protein n=1 Tax=Actinomadura terrae TaxID=604353 RepID=UPI001FA79DE1|nr:DUF397 domain-containing protein [Actinomadura terrae]